jgi:hypothetical protein
MSAAASVLRWPAAEARREMPAQRSAVVVPISSLAFYRRYTELLLRRYMQVSLHMGRVTSVLGNCVFRGRVSSYRIKSFDDAVIFVYDVEKCMRVLSPEQKELVARIALQEYTQAEAAELTHQSLRTVVRRYGEAVDKLTQVFLDKDLLEIGPLYGGAASTDDATEGEEEEEWGEEEEADDGN